MFLIAHEYNKYFMPGASTGVPTHDKVMWESSGGQGEPELKGCPLGLPEHLPQNQSLFYYFTTFTNSSDIKGGLSPITFL